MGFLKRILCHHPKWEENPLGLDYRTDWIDRLYPYRCFECGKVEYHSVNSQPIVGITKNPS